MYEPCTVVVASRNRPQHLRMCLECLSALKYPSVRVIVVDDGSDVPLAPMAAPFGDFVQVIRQDNRGPAAARNLGVEAAQTDFIAFTDDDCRPAPDWLTRLQEAQVRPGGAYRRSDGQRPFRQCLRRSEPIHRRVPLPLV